MRYVNWLAVVLGCAFAALQAGPAEARRVALVIGNADYKIGPLQNPVSDAAAVAEAFEKALKFDKVILRRNLGAEGFRAALLELSREASGAELGVVYFAGHGTEVGGKNFLIPVDASLARASALALEAIPLDAVLEQLDGVRKLKLVILDACRNNIFQLSGAKRSQGRGLVRIEPEGNTLVAFAAKEGTTADDGKGRHSPYTAALLKHIATPGLEINLLFRRVRTDVLAATGGSQQPAEYHSLGDKEIFLVPPLPSPTVFAPVAPASVPPKLEPSLAATSPPSQSRFAPQTFEQYLSIYPFPKPPTEIAAKIKESARIRTLFSSELEVQKAGANAVGNVIKAFLHRHLKLKDIDRNQIVEHEVFGIGSQRVLGKNVQIFVSASKLADWECRACGVELSMFEFIDDFGRLSLGSVALGVGSYGQWGHLEKNKVAVATIGPDRYGILVEGGGMFPGAAIEIFETLVVPVAGTYLTVFQEMTIVGSPSDAIGDWTDFRAEVRFLPRDGYFFDISLEKAVVSKSGRKSREAVLFEFDGVHGAYRKTKVSKR